MKWWPRQKNPESQKEQKQPEPPRINTHRSSIEKDVQDGHMQAAIGVGSTLVTHVSATAIHSPNLPSELPYVGRNLDALQKRIAAVLDALNLIGDRTICVNDYARVCGNLNRLQDEAKRQGSKMTRLAGSRELAIMSGNPLLGTPYPLMAMLPGALPLPENSRDIMFWVPGRKQFYRVIAYHFENRFADGRIFDGNTFILDERLLDGTDLQYCVVDEWGHASVLPRDPVTALFVPSLRGAIHPAYKGPLIAGNPIDSDSWKWAGQVQGRDVIFLGNVV
jgi:hypothetical protein